jgi:hypothetical protein
MVRSPVDNAVSGADAAAPALSAAVPYPVFDYSDLLDLPAPAAQVAECPASARPPRPDWLRSMRHWMHGAG